jgi:hypothetical protein
VIKKQKIRNHKGVDLVVGPSILTERDRQIISEIIATYKRTGKLPAKETKGRLYKRRKTSVRRSSISS